MEKGTIVAVDGKIYEYVEFDEHLKCHKLSEIEIDEEGHLTATYAVCYMTVEKFALSEEGTEYFTNKQWYGIVEHFIRQDYELTDEAISDAVTDIVDRCFAYKIPAVHKLADYIAEYMDR